MSLTSTETVLSPRARWIIVGLLSASIAINLLDRHVLSVLASELRNLFHWSNAQYGYIAVFFNLGMMCGQVPAGALMDRLGTRTGLAIIFVVWSLLSVAHAFAGSLATMLGISTLAGFIV